MIGWVVGGGRSTREKGEGCAEVNHPLPAMTKPNLLLPGLGCRQYRYVKASI